MSVLSKEDFMSKIKGVLGDDTSDESIQLLEDITDTYNDLESKQGDTENWKQKFEDNDKMWREKYTSRFFDSPATSDPAPVPKIEEKTEEEIKAESVQIRDIFTAEKE